MIQGSLAMLERPKEKRPDGKHHHNVKQKVVHEARGARSSYFSISSSGLGSSRFTSSSSSSSAISATPPMALRR